MADQIEWALRDDGSLESEDALYRIAPMDGGGYDLRYAETGEVVLAGPVGLSEAKAHAEALLDSSVRAADRILNKPAPVCGNAPIERHERWEEVKRGWSDHALLLRSGDIYETFDRDAEVVARCLNDSVGRRSGRRWWGCSADSLKAALDRLGRAGVSAAVGDSIDGEHEVMESGGGIASIDLRWPSRPVKAEHEAGHLLDLWESRCGEARVSRVEPLDGSAGWFEGHLQGWGDEDWVQVHSGGRTLQAAFKGVIEAYRKTSEARSGASHDLADLLDHARAAGILGVVEDEKKLAENGEIASSFGPESVRIGIIAPGPGQREDAMTATMTAEAKEAIAGMTEESTRKAPDLPLSEADARQLAYELGWKMDLKDSPTDLVFRHLNGIATTTPVNELSKPETSEARANLKMVLRTIQAGSLIVLGDGAQVESTGAVEEKSKRKVKASGGKKKEAVTTNGPSNKEVVYRIWKKKPSSTTAEECLKAVDGAVKLTTISSWLNQWKNGKNLPACAK